MTKITARLNATKTADNPTAVVQPDSDKHICLQHVLASRSAVRLYHEI